MTFFLRKIAVTICLLSILPNFALAATLYFDPPLGSLGPDNTFALDILLDVEGCVNTIEADISFPKDSVQAQDFIIGDSILSIWLEQPNDNDIALANETGIINFSGGVPGGYCGKIPGDPGKSNTVARIIFHVDDIKSLKKEINKLNFFFLPSTKVLLNDGLGTSDVLTMKTASFNYVDEKVDINDNWLKQIDNDTIAPEPFIIELRRSKNMFNNQYYIIFSTVDKQSGIDHFEVLEVEHDKEFGTLQTSFWDKLLRRTPTLAQWKTAKIPYLLNDQKLLSTIRVKAIDKAGNERFVEYIPPEISIVKANNSYYNNKLLMIFVLIIVIGLLVFFIKKIIINRKYDKE